MSRAGVLGTGVVAIARGCAGMFSAVADGNVSGRNHNAERMP